MARHGLVVNLGRMSYEPCAELQKRVLEEVASGERPDTLLFVEHPPVLTLGANFHQENLLLSLEEYKARGIEVYETDRGGDVTYHGPKQLVIYPIFDLRRHGKDLHRWMRDLEETMIRSLAHFDVEGYRFPPHTGVWVKGRKVAAIGVKIRRWVSMHGIALNCNNDLSSFNLIVPCGIQQFGVTSLSAELAGREVTIADAMPVVQKEFESVFELRFKQETLPAMPATLG